jgi:hypothetical protein
VKAEEPIFEYCPTRDGVGILYRATVTTWCTKCGWKDQFEVGPVWRIEVNELTHHDSSCAGRVEDIRRSFTEKFGGGTYVLADVGSEARGR